MSVSTLPPSLRLFAPPLEAVGTGLEVPVLLAGSREYVNLDLAATAPCLSSVWQAVTDALPFYGSVHRGSGLPSQVCSERFEHARASVAAFVGAGPDQQVVFTANTTGALNLLAHCLPADATVITFWSEHHANLLPWPAARTVRLPIPRSAGEAIAAVRRALELTRGPRLVCVTGASNVTGEVWPVGQLAAVAHAAGARLAVDGAQLVPHRPVDMSADGIDYLAFSGHKLYAPFGAGALVGAADWLDAAPPFTKGGGATRQVTRDEVAWQDGPARHEAGSPNLIGALALGAACRALSAAGLHRLAGREEALRARLERGLATIDGLRILRTWAQHDDRVGVLAFTLDGWDGPHLSAVLSAEHAVGVRAGRFCAHPLVEQLSARSDRGATGAREPVRISWGATTTVTDIDRAVDALRLIARYGAAWDYDLTDAGWQPRDDTRPAQW